MHPSLQRRMLLVRDVHPITGESSTIPDRVQTPTQNGTDVDGCRLRCLALDLTLSPLNSQISIFKADLFPTIQSTIITGPRILLFRKVHPPRDVFKELYIVGEQARNEQLVLLSGSQKECLDPDML